MIYKLEWATKVLVTIDALILFYLNLALIRTLIPLPHLPPSPNSMLCRHCGLYSLKSRLLEGKGGRYFQDAWKSNQIVICSFVSSAPSVITIYQYMKFIWIKAHLIYKKFLDWNNMNNPVCYTQFIVLLISISILHVLAYLHQAPQLPLNLWIYQAESCTQN